MRPSLLLCLWLTAFMGPVFAQAPCNSGVVFEDRNGNARRDRDEPGIAGVRLSDGVELVETDARGHYSLPVVDGRTSFVIKPAGYAFASRADGLPAFWHHIRQTPGPALRYGGLPVQPAPCRDYALRRQAARSDALDVLLFADPQPKSATDVGYFERDIVAPLVRADGASAADLGLSLGDIVHDDLALYPALNAVTARLRTPWLHAAGNHDLDFDAPGDEESLSTFRRIYGPDTMAWEEAEATFIVLDDVIYRRAANPEVIGGLREDQFRFLERYLRTVPKQRLLVLGMHIPLFDTSPRMATFRAADRERLFALLRDFPRVLLLSGHAHTQRHVLHDAASGWHGAAPLHEYNVGAASGAFWSGARDAAGIPDARMSDGTPNGYARLRIEADGDYALSWHPARLDDSDASRTGAMALHAPRVLRRGAYPAFGVYANVYMGRDDTRVEYRIDDGPWQAMRRVEAPDPALLAENARDDASEVLRGFDRSPEATPSRHLWRGTLPTDLAAGVHRVDVRAFDRWNGEQRARIDYRLDEASE